MVAYWIYWYAHDCFEYLQEEFNGILQYITEEGKLNQIKYFSNTKIILFSSLIITEIIDSKYSIIDSFFI